MRAIVLAALLMIGACSSIPAQVPVARVDGVLLERASGRTLYTNDRDDAPFAKLFCADECLRGWVPLAAARGVKGAKDFMLIERQNGALQWAYRDRPLYLRDGEAPGERGGHGVGNMWRIARP